MGGKSPHKSPGIDKPYLRGEHSCETNVYQAGGACTINKSVFILAIYALLGLLPPTVLSQSLNDLYADDIRISCFDLSGLYKRLEDISNEMQIYNNDEKTWHSKDWCAITPRRPYAFTPQQARRAGASEHRSRNIGLLGWLITDDWLVPVERIFYTDNNSIAYRPAGIYSREDYFLFPYCMNRTRKFNGVELHGHMFTAGNPADNLAKAYCRAPMLGDPKDYSHLWGANLNACDCSRECKR